MWEGEQVCVEVGACGGVGAQILASSLGAFTEQHTQSWHCRASHEASPDQQFGSAVVHSHQKPAQHCQTHA